MNRLKVPFYITLFSQILLVLISFIVYKEITLLHYINISFFITFIFLFSSISIFIINTGFFDVTVRSFRLYFSEKNMTKEEINNMKPFSQIISINYSLILISGLMNLFFMFAALILYYL